MTSEHDRIRQNVYNAVFQALDSEPELTGLECGAIATACEQIAIALFNGQLKAETAVMRAELRSLDELPELLGLETEVDQ